MYSEKLICSQCSEGILNVLNYGSRLVRTFYLENALWWALNDVCGVINLSNASSAAARLYEYEKMTLTLDDSHYQQRGGARKLILINESGLYHLLLTSTKPEAKLFLSWVTIEVLPSIRRNGGYILGQDSMDAVELKIAAGRVAQSILVERDRQIRELRSENADQAALIREYEPKARYYDAVLCSQDVIPIRLIAKDYGVSAQRLNKYLHERRVQYKCAGTWLLYQPYAGWGYTQTRTILDGSSYSKLLTYWTPKGRTFLYDFLRADGILPISEQLNVPWNIEDFEPIHTSPESGPQ